MEKIASLVYKMMDHQREIMVKKGLLDRDTKEDWESNFKFYVPTKGFAASEKGDEYEQGAQSRGFSIVGRESMKAKGRTTLPLNPILTAIEDVQKKIIRGEKNETSQVLLDLVYKLGQDSPSWTIYTPEFRPPVKGDEGMENPRMQTVDDMRGAEARGNNDPQYIEVKRDGASYFIYFKSDTLNHSLQNMSVPALNRANEDLGKALNFMTRIQNFRRNMYINYNPSWAFINPARDIPTGLFYLLGEMDKKGSRSGGENLVSEAAKGVPSAMRSLYRYYREKPAREGNEWDKYVVEFHEDGTQTGLMLIDNPAEQLRILKSKLKKGSTRNAVKALGKWVEDFNTAAENGIRLAIYVAARKSGIPRGDASTLGKDSTVNFNRKGETTPTMNAMFLFFGAAIQGNVNIMQSLGNDGSSGKRFGGKKRFTGFDYTTAQASAAGLVALGAGIAALNIYNSEDDDDGDKEYADIPEHAKNRVLLIMGADGQEGIAPPMAYGYNFFTNIGRYITEYFMDISTGEEVAVNLLDNILLNFVPIHHAKGDNIWENLRGFYPDMLEMHQDIMANTNYFGGQIAIEQNPLFVQRSDSYMARRSTSKNLKDIAQFMNDATGGDEFNNGYLHPNPDRMKFILQYWLGGAGKALGQGADVINRLTVDHEIGLKFLAVLLKVDLSTRIDLSTSPTGKQPER